MKTRPAPIVDIQGRRNSETNKVLHRLKFVCGKYCGYLRKTWTNQVWQNKLFMWETKLSTVEDICKRGNGYTRLEWHNNMFLTCYLQIYVKMKRTKKIHNNNWQTSIIIKLETKLNQDQGEDFEKVTEKKLACILIYSHCKRVTFMY